ncbi:voltage-gated sodium channel type IV alpha [Sarotherodon galilaeus]
MAANRVGRRVNKVCGNPSPCHAGGGRDPGQSPQRRRARVTVMYNRDELQRRLEAERWIDRGLDRLYRGREEDMPEEVNIDELLDLKTDEERTHRLQDCQNKTGNRQISLTLTLSVLCSQVFISELLLKLHGLQKQEDLHNDGIDLPQLHISRQGGAALKQQAYLD